MSGISEQEFHEDAPLSLRQENFCRAYAQERDHIKSAKEAGFPAKHGNRAIGIELLNIAKVRERVLQLIREKHVADDMPSDEVLARIAAIIRFDPRTIFDLDGSVLGPRHWSDEAAMAIASITVEEKTDRDGVTTRIKKINLHDRLKALEDYAKYWGLFSRDNSQKGAAAAETLVGMFEKIRQENSGVKSLIQFESPQGSPLATF